MTQSVTDFFNRHEVVCSVNVLLVDVNGTVRGKQLTRAMFEKVCETGTCFPQSIFASDIRGRTVRGTGLGIESGDQDRLCRPDIRTLRIVPGTNSRTAQCQLDMFEEDGSPFASSPRQLLKSVVESLHERNIYPQVALELEFYLLQREFGANGFPRRLPNPATGLEDSSCQIYAMDEIENVQPFLDRVKCDSAEQSVPASTVVAENAPGQFEINLDHRTDPVDACDDAICLKQIIRRAANSTGLLATFMAKPFEEFAGSGCHVHVSLWTEKGENRLAGSPNELGFAVAGLQKTMLDSMLVFAPHANSHRRFGADTCVPLSPSWGRNNRSVALRVPAGPDESTRIEHRVAGADANPYLVLVAILAGMLHGIESRNSPGQPVAGDAAKQNDASLLIDWQRSIESFRNSSWVEQYFGRPFQSLMADIKQAEYSEYRRHVPRLDFDWYLRSA